MGFIDTFFRRRSSGTMAKDRLKLVLVSDRASCSPETMEMMVQVTAMKILDIPAAVIRRRAISERVSILWKGRSAMPMT